MLEREELSKKVEDAKKKAANAQEKLLEMRKKLLEAQEAELRAREALINAKEAELIASTAKKSAMTAKKSGSKGNDVPRPAKPAASSSKPKKPYKKPKTDGPLDPIPEPSLVYQIFPDMLRHHPKPEAQNMPKSSAAVSASKPAPKKKASKKSTSTAANTASSSTSSEYVVWKRAAYGNDGFHAYYGPGEKEVDSYHSTIQKANERVRTVFIRKNPWGLGKEEIYERQEVSEKKDKNELLYMMVHPDDSEKWEVCAQERQVFENRKRCEHSDEYDSEADNWDGSGSDECAEDLFW